ncbi:MAG: choice-of-anchor G family protein [Rhodoglobus sp.]
MFTQHIPGTGKPVGNTKHSPVVRFGAALGTVALVSGFTLAVDALGTSVINQPGGIQLPMVDVLDAGVISHYAQADKDGESFASTGAIQNDGGLGVGNVSAGPAGGLTLDLGSLLDNQFASVLTDLKLDLGAVAARADGSMTSASGDYTLADAALRFSSPAISQLTNKVITALSGVDGQLLSLGSDDGALGNSINRILDPLLGVVGSSAEVKVVIDADAQNTVSSLLIGQYGNGAVSFNLETGVVLVHLETLLGSDLNDLPPNTELLTDAVVNQILNGITETVGTLADDIVDLVESALRNARVGVSANLNLLTAQNPLQ